METDPVFVSPNFIFEGRSNFISFLSSAQRRIEIGRRSVGFICDKLRWDETGQKEERHLVHQATRLVRLLAISFVQSSRTSYLVSS